MKPQSTCLIFNCVLSFFVLSVRTEIYPCESEEWKYFDYSCYWSSLYNQNPLIHQTNWFNAARECRKRNSNLVSIRNQRENQMIFTLNRCANAWIGLVMIDNNLTMSESDFIERREEFDLAQGNLIGTLDRLKKEYTVIFNVKPRYHRKGRWQSVFLLTNGSTVNFYGGRNPGVWFHEDGSGRLRIHASVSGDSHYFFDTKSPLTLNKWSNVKIYQRMKGGRYWFSVDINGENVHSVENTDARDFENMKVYASDPWDLPQYGSLSDLLVYSLKTGWEWFDNSKRNYTNWKLNKSHGDKFECSYLHNGDGKWANNLHCGDYLNYYVCKKQLKFDTFLNIPTDFDTYFNMSTDFDTYFKMPTDFEIFRGLCGNGWVLLGEKCYYVSLSKVDYFEAMIQCQSKQGHLVSIHSSKENTDLIRVFNSCETLWIGIENIDPSKVSEIVGWKWSDGTLVNYHNWKDGGIENDQTKQCGTLQSGAKWINVSCWELHLFVCEKPKPK